MGDAGEAARAVTMLIVAGVSRRVRDQRTQPLISLLPASDTPPPNGSLSHRYTLILNAEEPAQSLVLYHIEETEGRDDGTLISRHIGRICLKNDYGLDTKRVHLI